MALFRRKRSEGGTDERVAKKGKGGMARDLSTSAEPATFDDPIIATSGETDPEAVAAGHDPMSLAGNATRTPIPEGFDDPIIAREDFDDPILGKEGFEPPVFEEEEPGQP